MPLGNHIRNLRKSRNLTLQQLSYLVDADAGNLSRIERGELGVSETMLRKIAAALNTTPANLYAESDASEAQLAVDERRSAYITPQTQVLNKAGTTNAKDFVYWFRSATPYIHAFGGRTFVIAFGGEVVNEQQFIALSHDLNLLASLEVRLVLVHGARPQIEQRLKRDKLTPIFHNGLRVTNDEAMEAVKEANGAVRVEIEALLSMGIANSPMAGADIRVASGNFVTAKPLGCVTA